MLVNLGIITGYEDGNFGGSDSLTRQQASSIFVKTLQHLDVNVNTLRQHLQMKNLLVIMLNQLLITWRVKVFNKRSKY